MSQQRSTPRFSSGHKRERSPEERSKDELEMARRARMERLRSENEAEERRLVTALQETPKGPKDIIMKVNDKELEGLEEEEQMRLLLGFEGFGTTKGTKVEDNHQTSAKGAAAKNKARKYRQYMNRKNGFNRPLDKMD